MRLIEGSVEGGSAVTRCTEGDALRGDRRIRNEVKVGAQEGVDVDEVRWLGNKAGAFMHGASVSLEDRARQG